jgi:hypothetical protein
MTRDEKVQHIAELMAGKAPGWHGGKSQRELATAWGETVSNVQTLAGEAGARIRAAQADPSLVGLIHATLAEIDGNIAKLDELADLALKGPEPKPKGWKPNLMVAEKCRADIQRCVDAKLRVLGAAVPGARQVPRVGQQSREDAPGRDLAKLSRAELIAETKARLAELEAEDAAGEETRH